MYKAELNKCIIPGSFDPFTLGHLDLVKSVWDLFDQVDILVAINPDKEYMFSADERVKMIENIIKDLNNAQKECVHVHKWGQATVVKINIKHNQYYTNHFSTFMIFIY